MYLQLEYRIAFSRDQIDRQEKEFLKENYPGTGQPLAGVR